MVEDNGPGLSLELRERLLGDLASFDAPSRPRAELGLGLAIVCHAARALRAQVSLDSRNDKGTRVRMIIPLAAAA